MGSIEQPIIIPEKITRAKPKRIETAIVPRPIRKNGNGLVQAIARFSTVAKFYH